MPFFFQKPIEPLDLTTFRKHLLRYYFFHILAVIIGLVLFWLGWKYNSVKFNIAGIVCFSILVFIPYLTLSSSIQGRLHCLYPSVPQESLRWIAGFSIIPISWLALLMFLMVKNTKGPIEEPPFVFRWMKSVGVGLFIFVLLLVTVPIQTLTSKYSVSKYNAKMAYWIANPTISYLFSIREEVLSLMEIKEKFAQNPEHPNPIHDLISLSERRTFTVTGIVLMDSITVNYYLKQKEKNREIASPQIGIAMLEDLAVINEIGRKSLPSVFTFNPINYLASTLEMALLCGVSLLVEYKYQEVFGSKVTEIIRHLESELPKVSNASEQEALKLRLNKVLARFAAVRI